MDRFKMAMLFHCNVGNVSGPGPLTEADRGDGQRDHLRDEAVPAVAAARVQLHAQRRLVGDVEGSAVRGAGVRQLCHQPRRHVPDVAVIQSEGVGHQVGGVARVDQVKLQQTGDGDRIGQALIRQAARLWQQNLYVEEIKQLHVRKEACNMFRLAKHNDTLNPRPYRGGLVQPPP